MYVNYKTWSGNAISGLLVWSALEECLGDICCPVLQNWLLCRGDRCLDPGCSPPEWLIRCLAVPVATAQLPLQRPETTSKLTSIPTEGAPWPWMMAGELEMQIKVIPTPNSCDQGLQEFVDVLKKSDLGDTWTNGFVKSCTVFCQVGGRFPERADDQISSKTATSPQTTWTWPSSNLQQTGNLLSSTPWALHHFREVKPRVKASVGCASAGRRIDDAENARKSSLWWCLETVAVTMEMSATTVSYTHLTLPTKA